MTVDGASGGASGGAVAASSVPADTWAAGDLGIVYFGNEWFAENRTSSHHMARQLAARVPLLYVDSPGMRAPTTSGRDLRRVWRKLCQALQRPRRVAPGLWHCTVPQLPWHGLPGVGWLNRRFGAWAVGRAMRLAGIRQAILWFVVPHPGFMLDELPHRLAVYHCIDDYAAHPGVDVQHVAACDADLCRRADVVLVAPPALVPAQQRLNSAARYFPHGVDTELFAQAQAAATPVPAVAAALVRPVVGYFGLIAAWTDVDLIGWLARQRPNWQFLLIGHAAVDIAALARLPNVRWVGAQPYESLPGWAKAFDVAIIPYRLNRQVQHANPLKLREYLATGKPVVSVPTPEVGRFAAVVRQATGAQAFLAEIEACLHDDNATLREQRMRSVQGMSWPQRADEAWQIACDALARKSGQPAR